jgi:OHCU decarboxylase
MLDQLNKLNASDATTEFLKCCGSQNWANRMVASRPFSTLEEMCSKASEIWWSLNSSDWLEAFRSHPKIGERKAATDVSSQSLSWSSQEQSGVAIAQEQTLSELSRLNRDYEEKFGYIYIVCATGKSSEEMLDILKSRIDNQPDQELHIAAGEQEKITDIRLRKLCDS